MPQPTHAPGTDGQCRAGAPRPRSPSPVCRAGVRHRSSLLLARARRRPPQGRDATAQDCRIQTETQPQRHAAGAEYRLSTTCHRSVQWPAPCAPMCQPLCATPRVMGTRVPSCQGRQQENSTHTRWQAYVYRLTCTQNAERTRCVSGDHRSAWASAKQCCRLFLCLPRSQLPSSPCRHPAANTEPVNRLTFSHVFQFVSE